MTPNFSFESYFQDSIIHALYNDILLIANSQNREYQVVNMPESLRSKQLKYLYKPIIDNDFVNFIINDSNEVSIIYENPDTLVFHVEFLDPGEVDSFAYNFVVLKKTNIVIEYERTFIVAGIPVWENLKLFNAIQCKKQVEDTLFFSILKTFKPKCPKPPISPKVETLEKEIPKIIHDTLPFLNLISTKGDSLRIMDGFSKFYLVDYWFRSCMPCIKSLPALKYLHSNFDSTQLKVISINSIDKSNSLIEKFAKDNNISYEIYTHTQEFGKKFEGVNSFPTFVLYDENFKVLKILEGFSENLEEEIVEVIKNNM